MTPPGGTVLHAFASRSEAVRLAPVATALRTMGIAGSLQLVAPGASGAELFDRDGVPRTEAIVGARCEDAGVARSLVCAERALLAQPPSMVVLGGDSDGSLALALAASRLGIPIARVGAGLRCGDFSVPEEVNRVLGDRLADILFTDSTEAGDTLEVEGIGSERVFHAGNTAVDLLRRCADAARQVAMWRRFGVTPGGYVLATLHRAENVRDAGWLARFTDALAALAQRIPIVFPIHPLTRALMELAGDIARLETAGVRIAGPLGYLDFLSLEQAAGAILTDSGGVQDEAAVLGVRCYTLRRSTERVETLTHGTNVLLGDDPAEIAAVRIAAAPPAPATIPLWDGRAADRVAAELTRRLAAGPRASLSRPQAPRAEAPARRAPARAPGAPGSLTVLAGGAADTSRREAPARRFVRTARDTVVHIAGAWSNLVATAPVIAALEERGAFRQVVVRVRLDGDPPIGDDELAELGFPPPDRFLEVGAGGYAAQMARTLSAFGAVLREERPIAVVVAGDANPALACALAATKRRVPVARVAAGRRSFERNAPQEINRMLTDRLSDLLFTDGQDAGANLRAEGILESRIHCVGDATIDSLRRRERLARGRRMSRTLGLAPASYVLVALERPGAPGIADALIALAGRFPVVLVGTGDARLESAGVRCLEAVGHLDLLSLQADAGAVVTDSGAVQAETSAQGVRCYTFCAASARPVTITHGTNVLLGDDPASLSAVEPAGWAPTPAAISLWDGRAGARIADVLVANYALARAFHA